MKIKLLIFILFICFLGIILNIYNKNNIFNLVYVEDGLDYNIENDLVRVLNKSIKQNKLYTKHKKVDIYVGGFYSSFNTNIINKDNYNILRLGSLSNINLKIIKQFDLVLTSSNDLNILLNQNNINSYLLPLYNSHLNKKNGKCVLDNKDDCYWLVIGNQIDVEKYMNENNYHYKKITNFNNDNIATIKNDFDNIKGVIVGKSRISDNSYDLHPIFLELIIRKIPILTNDLLNSKKSSDSFLSYFFSDAISYYSYNSDIDYFFQNEQYRINKSVYGYNYFLNFFSTEATANKIINLLGFNNQSDHKVVSIFSPTPAGLYNNGDYWIAKDIEEIFNDNHFVSSVYFPTSLISNVGDIDIYIRGGMPLKKRELPENKTSIGYILFPFLENEENFTQKNIDIDKYVKSIKSELTLYDAVAVASSSMTNLLKKHNINAYYIPQFTNTSKFYPDYEEELKSDILFIGNKTFYRKAPSILLNNNFPITIYGNGWGDVAKSQYVDNKILRKYYSSAKIVLNDTRDAMKKFGFIINRIFDVSASGGFIISDYMKEIEDVFGDSIVMYKNDEELINLVKYYLDPKNEEERLAKIKKARETT